MKRFVFVVSILGIFMNPVSVFAQEGQEPRGQISAKYDPETQVYYGHLQTGEVLISALKREKVEETSIVEACKSIGEVFDLRYSRTNDLYEFKLTGGRKIALLRYHRGKHVYEAIRQKNGLYVAELLKAPVRRPQERTVLDVGDTDWQDSQHVQEIDSPRPPSLPSEMHDLDRDEPERPTPEDLVLAAKPSPDAEYPDVDLRKADSDDSTMNELDALSDHFVAGEHLPTDQPRKENGDVPQEQDLVSPKGEVGARGLAAEPEPPSLPRISKSEAHGGKSPVFKSPQNPRAQARSMPLSYRITFVIGLCMILAAIGIVIYPQVRLRSRLKKQNMWVKSVFSLNAKQKIVLIEFEEQFYLIGITESGMIPLACGDKQGAQEKLRSIKKQTYWQNMAKKPLTDEEMRELLLKSPQTPEEEDILGLIQSASHPTLTLEQDLGVSEDSDAFFKTLHIN